MSDLDAFTMPLEGRNGIETIGEKLLIYLCCAQPSSGEGAVSEDHFERWDGVEVELQSVLELKKRNSLNEVVVKVAKLGVRIAYGETRAYVPVRDPSSDVQHSRQ
jgi:hypothetical protein